LNDRRWTWLAAALLAIGMLVRIALYFPLAMYQIDSDAVIAGLCAFRVAEGQYPLFLPGGVRISAASCYVAAGYFHVFGAGRVGLALTALTWGFLFLLFMLLFLRAVLGPKAACLAFLFAVFPPEQFMTVTYAPWGYGEIMASCAATLWLATLWRRSGTLWQRLWFGFSVGLGLWFSMQTLMIAIPAIIWIALKRRGALVREALPAVGGMVVGLLPLLIGNIARGFPTFTANWASRPASSPEQVVENLVWVLSVLIPKLLVRLGGSWPETLLFTAADVAIAIGFAFAWRRRPEIAQLLALVIAACILIFSLSNAGSIRGWTVRYIAPLYLIVPVFAATGIQYIWRRSQVLAGAVVVALVLPNLFLYGLPGSSLRAELTQQFRDDQRLRQRLEQHNVRMLYGNYVWVYHLNFDCLERIAGVSFDVPFDYYNYGGRLGTAPIRWAALGNSDEVAGWIKRSGAHGTITPYEDLQLFIADTPAPNAAKLLAALRRT
jgi:hypothetical protein